MHANDFAGYLLTLPLAELKRIKKAVTILTRAGMNRQDAIDCIISHHSERKSYDARLGVLRVSR